MTQTPSAKDLDRCSYRSDERNLYLTITWVMQVLLGVGLVLFLLRRNWENVFLTAVVIALTLVPASLLRDHPSGV
jgi:hypothetical protein